MAPVSGRSPAPVQLPSFQPAQVAKAPPCQEACPVNGDVRGWVGVVAQREKLGLDEASAFRRAWETIADLNPFPAALGRICPHPCEAGCNRGDKDGAVAINALEQFLGDWAIEQALPLPLDGPGYHAETVGVVGAGPSGLSFAYQMARRGYPVTVYESNTEPGGMLRYGVPDYRLPRHVLDAEIERIRDIGVDILCGTQIGTDVSIEELRRRHDLLYVGIGAQRSRTLDIPGAEGPGVISGVEYLGRVNRGESVRIGSKVAIVGGGNTAIDAARTAIRSGANVTVLYRRTRDEMPAADEEIAEAIAEGVDIRYLLAPVELRRREGTPQALIMQPMELGGRDASGRRRPVASGGPVVEFSTDTVIVAVAQVPDWAGLDGGELAHGVTGLTGLTALADDVWVGGDAGGPGIAGTAIAHGRAAAIAAHDRLRGSVLVSPEPDTPIQADAVKLDLYASRPRAVRARVPIEEGLAHPGDEVTAGLSAAEFVEEAARCFSCGLCFGCRQCFMYCTVASFTPVGEAGPGVYFSLSLDACRDCGKCVDVCPCGYLEMATSS